LNPASAFGPEQYSAEASIRVVTGVDVELDTAVGSWNHSFPKPSETAEESAGFVAAAVTRPAKNSTEGCP